MLKSIIKEIIILLLLSIAILLILMVLFYEYIPQSEEIPTIQAYTTPGDVRNELDTTITEAEKVEVTYEVTDSDLNVYQQTGRYSEGKANPFSLTDETAEEPTQGGSNTQNTNDNTNTSTNENNQGSTIDKNSTGTFFNDEGIK